MCRIPFERGGGHWDAKIHETFTARQNKFVRPPWGVTRSPRPPLFLSQTWLSKLKGVVKNDVDSSPQEVAK